MFDFATWTNDNSLALMTIIVAVFGGIFAYLQWRKSVKLKRAEFLNQIIEKLRFNDEMTRAIYLIDYNQDWYGEGFHGGSENERTRGVLRLEEYQKLLAACGYHAIEIETYQRFGLDRIRSRAKKRSAQEVLEALKDPFFAKEAHGAFASLYILARI